MNTATRILTLVVVGTMAAPVLGDWNVGDPYKMHYPQLPNNSAQDMNILLADDWLCTGTGPVSDVHFWTMKDALTPQAPIYMAIFTNDPNFHELGYSAPALMVWDRYLTVYEYTVRDWDGLHWQYNITDIVDPFIQTAGEVYWLGLRIQTNDPHHYWSYSDTRFMDTAVQWDWVAQQDPFPLSSDLAFVITPEPASLSLLALGGLALVRSRRRR